MRETKAIALLIPLLTGGGAERTISNLSIALADEYDMHLIVFDASNATYPYKGTLHDLQIHASNNIFARFFNFWRRVVAVRRIKRKNNILVSISFLGGPNLVNCYSRVNDKIITSVRNEKTEYYKRDGRNIDTYRCQQKICNQKSDQIVAISDGVKKDLIENFGTPFNIIKTIYNPCDINYISKRATESVDIVNDMPELSITTMGRLTFQKNHWSLIRAIKIVLNVVQDVHLYILGEGELRNDLEKLARDLKIESNIHFVGYVNNPHTFINKSKAFVFPSLYEGLGNVLLEAMACGVPCIASDCYSGPREILDESADVRGDLEEFEMVKYGILVSNDAEMEISAERPFSRGEHQMADAIVKILTDKELWHHYSEMGKRRVGAFSPELIKEKWINVIENLVGEGADAT